MPSLKTLFFVLTVLISSCASAEDRVNYEPAVVSLTGVLSHGKFRHPNGTWVPLYVLKLSRPVVIESDSVNRVNVVEHDVREVQIAMPTREMLKSTGPKIGKRVIVTGTIFHEHTAWHVRKLVMMPASIKIDAATQPKV